MVCHDTEGAMDERRKLREDLTPEEFERLKRYGFLAFKSVRRPRMRVEPFLPSKDQH
jgi:hypothetical protein